MTQFAGRIPSSPNGWVELVPDYTWQSLAATGVIPPDATGVLIQCSVLNWGLDQAMMGGAFTGFPLSTGQTLRLTNAADLRNLYFVAYDTVYMQFFTGPTGELPEIMATYTPPAPSGVNSVTCVAPIENIGTAADPVIDIHSKWRDCFWVDGNFGNDATAVPNDQLHPYKTIEAAQLAAAGELVTFYISGLPIASNIPAYVGPCAYHIVGHNNVQSIAISNHCTIYCPSAVIGQIVIDSSPVVPEVLIFANHIGDIESYIDTSCEIHARYINRIYMQYLGTITAHAQVVEVDAYDKTNVTTYGTTYDLKANQSSSITVYGNVITCTASDDARITIHGDVVKIESSIESVPMGYITVWGHVIPNSNMSLRSYKLIEIHGNITTDFDFDIQGTAKVVLHGVITSTRPTAIQVYSATYNPTLILYNAKVKVPAAGVAIAANANSNVYAYDSYTNGTLTLVNPLLGGTLTTGATLP